MYTVYLGERQRDPRGSSHCCVDIKAAVTSDQSVIQPQSTPDSPYSATTRKASLAFVVILCAASWLIFFFVASSADSWPSPALPGICTAVLIYSIYNYRRMR